MATESGWNEAVDTVTDPILRDGVAAEGRSARHIPHDRLAPLYHYWRSLAEPPQVPHYRQLDPLQFWSCIGHIILADLEPEPFRVRYHLVGEKLVSLYGRDPTGECLETTFLPSVRKRVVAAYRSVAETGDARYDHVRFTGFVSNLSYHRLMLPLRRHGPAIDRVMVAIFPDDPRLQVADDWRMKPDVQAYRTTREHLTPE